VKATDVMVEVRTGDITNEKCQLPRLDFQLCSCSSRYRIKERRKAETFLRHITFSLLVKVPRPHLLTLVITILWSLTVEGRIWAGDIREWAAKDDMK
jgi:hypothetical protein